MSLYRGLEQEPHWESRGGRAPGEGSVGKAPEAESSVALEVPAEEPNLTLVTDSFLACHSLSPQRVERLCYGSVA